MKKEKLAIIGATGLVGRTFLHLIEEKKFDDLNIKVIASNHSKGKKMRVNGKIYTIMGLDEHSFDDVSYACFFSTNEVSKQYIPIALSNKVKVIDNSSAFRMDEKIKLIAYGANENLLNGEEQLIANPNCCIIQCIVLLSKLVKFNINKIIYNTYQSVSGSGKQGIDDLIRCRRGLMPLFYETDISFTCIPKIGEINENGISDEEIKLIQETKKILNMPELDVVATCVRVPVMFSHGVSVLVEFQNDFTIEEIKQIFLQYDNIVVCDNIVPTSILSCKNDKIYVGRIRKHNHQLLFYCVADNVRVGAATNAFEILQHILKLKES